MSRFILPAVVLSALSLGSLFPLVLVQETQAAQPPGPSGERPDGRRPRPPQMGGPGIPPIPGLEALASPQVLEKLELIDEQKEELREIAQKFIQQMQQNMAEVQQLPMEERQERMPELQQTMRKRGEEVRRQIAEVLLPHQLEILQGFNQRARRQAMFRHPQVCQQLELTEQQKKKLREIRGQMQQKMQQLEDEAYEEVLGVLTREQADKLNEMLGNRRPTKKPKK